MKSTSAELSLELQSQETHLTNCILTVLPKGFTVGFCANIIQSGIFLLWASCRQAQPGGTGDQGRYSHYLCFPSHNSFPPCHCMQVEFLVTDYIVSNISKAFHCCLWAQWLLELKRKEIKFHEGRWGAVISTRAQPPEAQPFSKPATEQVWKRPCNIALMSHPASINTPCLNCLLASPSVTKNTWTLSRKYYSNLQMQHFFVYFSFPKHRHCFSQKEISLQSPSLFILYAFFSWNFFFRLCYSAWALWQLIISVWEKSHSHRARLSSCSISSFKKRHRANY